ncbi:metallophosphoesterase family protein [Actinopolyspora mzabensis]|uniref:metallophosphoesterase family protein n=1 Tax=Actinopolyspora mzabensis TaxID=995066 RepID=UPI001C409ACC|nr:metallophosphoesterase [Actinopolyspora mzabensis]
MSDPHLDGGEHSTSRFERVLDHLRTLSGALDAVVVTGDIANEDAADEYRRATELSELAFPVFSCPGNHDDRTTYRPRVAARRTRRHDTDQPGPPRGRNAVRAL